LLIGVVIGVVISVVDVACNDSDDWCILLSCIMAFGGSFQPLSTAYKILILNIN
jgi:hypothetical protein